MNQKSLNLKLIPWFNRNTVDTNKPITATTRETFYHLYMYMSTYKNVVVFSPAIAKKIAFFVLSTPDSCLTNLLTQFDIYYKYLIQSRNHKFKAFKQSDLSKKDMHYLDAIDALYKDSDYDSKVAVIEHNYSFIVTKKDSRKLKSHDFIKFANIAKAHDMKSPVVVSVNANQTIITDYLQTFTI